MTIEGFLNIYKERGMTSHDVISRVRRITGIRRCGHTGTLDPEAEGVLPVAVGRATRLIEYLDKDLKRYECVMVLGRRFDSGDVWGTVTDEAPEAEVDDLSEAQILDAFKGYSGYIEQTPPIYSAVHIDGKRAYQYAREGKKVEMPKRRVFIKSLVILEVGPGRGYSSFVRFALTCGKGTYVRSICDEAGEKLGVHGAMASLIRTGTGSFDIKDALRLSEIEEIFAEADTSSALGPGGPERKPENIMIPPDAPLPHLGAVDLTDVNAAKFRNGLAMEARRFTIVREPEDPEDLIFLAYRGNEFLGVGMMAEDRSVISPEKIFHNQ